MKYLVAAEGDNLEAKVSRRFGHALNHLLVDSETREVQVVGGNVEEMPRHGLGRFTSRDDIAGVITGNVGPHAFEDMRSAGLPVYLVRGKTVREAVELVASGAVKASDGPSMNKSISEARGTFHGGGDESGQGLGRGHGQGRGQGLGHGQGQGGGKGSRHRR